MDSCPHTPGRWLRELPEHWQHWLDRWAKEDFQSEPVHLRATDFRGQVNLRFPDGSCAVFVDAFLCHR